MCSKLDENKVTTDKLNKAGDEEKKKTTGGRKEFKMQRRYLKI